MLNLFTIGYEGTILDQLLHQLVAAGAPMIVDVRAVPISRKPGFSKRMLASSLAASGILYQHLPSLGTPKPGRDAARSGRIADMRAIFGAHMQTEPAQLGLAEAIRLARTTPICLLCFEHDAQGCHRLLVAEAIAAATGQTPQHL